MKKVATQHSIVGMTTDLNWDSYNGGILDICTSNDLKTVYINYMWPLFLIMEVK